MSFPSLRHLSHKRRREVDGGHVEHMKSRLIIGRADELRQRDSRPGCDDERNRSQERSGFPPRVDPQQPVGSQNEAQPFWTIILHRANRVNGVGRAFPIDLDPRRREAPPPPNEGLHHSESVFSRLERVALLRRDAVRDEDDAAQAALAERLLRHEQVRAMRRIERAAEQPDPMAKAQREPRRCGVGRRPGTRCGAAP